MRKDYYDLCILDAGGEKTIVAYSDGWEAAKGDFAEIELDGDRLFYKIIAAAPAVAQEAISVMVDSDNIVPIKAIYHKSWEDKEESPDTAEEDKG